MVDTGSLLAYSFVVLGLFLIPGPAVLLTLARPWAAFSMVKYAGALYLIYLGVRASVSAYDWHSRRGECTDVRVAAASGS